MEAKQTVDFRLPTGRIVAIHADVAGLRSFISYELYDGSIVLAERVPPPTKAELVSLDHYNGCQYCSDSDRGYCDEGERLARLCVEVGQVCPNCDSMSEDGGLCWYCHDEEKKLALAGGR